MSEAFNLSEYMSEGIENILRNVLKSSIKNPKETAFVIKYMLAAKELGISFALLLGGEPLMRREVIEKASLVKEIVFPIFTNGTMFDESYINLFDKNRNLVPMISIEGDKGQTDGRRGIGTYNSIMTAMDSLNKKGILFGGSITVTTENIITVTSKKFVQELYNKGARGC